MANDPQPGTPISPSVIRAQVAADLAAATAAAGTTTNNNTTNNDNHTTTTAATTIPPPSVIKGRNDYYEPSVTMALFVYWIFPVLILALCTRIIIDTGPSSAFPNSSRPITITMNKGPNKAGVPKRPPTSPTSTPTTTTKTARKSTAYASPSESPSGIPIVLVNKPTNYLDVVRETERRRLDWSSETEFDDTERMVGGMVLTKQSRTTTNSMEQTSSNSRNNKTNRSQQKKQQQQQQRQTQQQNSQHHQSNQSSNEEVSRGASTDPIRLRFLEQIDTLRREYKVDPNDIYRGVALADALRIFDVQFHDGGSVQEEAIETYKKTIDLAWKQRTNKIENGEETNRSLTGTVDVNQEVTLPYSARSIDGFLCGAYTGLGKTYFMSNMFEKAVESYSKALEIDPYYLDAMSARGSSRIILGHYPDAAQDFVTVMELDTNRVFQDVFTGLARVLQAKESALPGGWDKITTTLGELIPALESRFEESKDDPESQRMISSTLNRFYHVLFLYHDVKTKDVDKAWEYLTKSYDHKKNTLAPWNTGFETQKVAATKSIFHRGFWPPGSGSDSRVPIFVIGFVRSGSTLLERVLDAHPQIVGTGENSVFNGRLDDIRNKIVQTSMLGDPKKLDNVIRSLAEDVVDEMRDRWQMVAAGEERMVGRSQPLRFVDKMLTNYNNVGFIHMLFPNALILHVAREPMDTIFSAYKHEFPSGPLDYTSFFPSLAEFYHCYRDLIEHWDRELPGRVTHIRYEDMVNDMPGVARKIIEKTGLEWDDSVLDFHNKKQAVNTLSTTQVRKGVYRHSLQAWRKYETHLQPLVDLIGERTKYNLKTSLPGYKPPSPEERVDETETDSAPEATDKSNDSNSDNKEMKEGGETVAHTSETVEEQQVSESSDQDSKIVTSVVDADGTISVEQ